MQNFQGFPVNLKLITCKVYIYTFFSIAISTSLPKVRNYGDFRHACNPHDNYMHVTWNTLRHRDTQHFLGGKRLQCRGPLTQILRKAFFSSPKIQVRRGPSEIGLLMTRKTGHKISYVFLCLFVLGW